MTLPIIRSGVRVVSAVANGLQKDNLKTLADNARAILGNAVDRAFSSLSNTHIGWAQRTYVTHQTHKKLQEAIPDRVDIGTKTPPYQEPGKCEFLAQEILMAKMTEARRGAASSSSHSQIGEGGLMAFWKKVRANALGDLETQKIPTSGEELLAKFNEKGMFILRGPGMGEGYHDHAVVVFSVSKINLPDKGPRIVAGLIDCNDKATDPQTSASRETARKLDKSLHELTQEEANENEAHLRRIRIVDGDALVKKTISEFSERASRFMNAGIKLDVEAPKIIVPREKMPSLSVQEAEGLSKILVEIYDTPEVEKFENQDSSKVEHDASAGQAKGKAVAKQLYETMQKKDG